VGTSFSTALNRLCILDQSTQRKFLPCAANSRLSFTMSDNIQGKAVVLDRLLPVIPMHGMSFDYDLAADKQQTISANTAPTGTSTLPTLLLPFLLTVSSVKSTALQSFRHPLDFAV
jgi:hypothetical protein